MSLLTLVSSRAIDVLLRPDGSVIDEIHGGPAAFIKPALGDAGIDFVDYEGDEMRVEIRVEDQAEVSRIKKPEYVRKLSDVDATPWCIVSTLLDEWTLDGIIPERTFLDVQGYVRDGTTFGAKKPWEVDEAISRQFYCLKGTEEEIGYLPAELIEYQRKNRILAVTRGRKGAVLYQAGEEIIIPADVIKNLPNTVGAGDTFLAYLAAGLYHGKDLRAAGTYASVKTSEFLLRKLS